MHHKICLAPLCLESCIAPHLHFVLLSWWIRDAHILVLSHQSKIVVNLWLRIYVIELPLMKEDTMLRSSKFRPVQKECNSYKWKHNNNNKHAYKRNARDVSENAKCKQHSISLLNQFASSSFNWFTIFWLGNWNQENIRRLSSASTSLDCSFHTLTISHHACF